MEQICCVYIFIQWCCVFIRLTLPVRCRFSRQRQQWGSEVWMIQINGILWVSLLLVTRCVLSCRVMYSVRTCERLFSVITHLHIYCTEMCRLMNKTGFTLNLLLIASFMIYSVCLLEHEWYFLSHIKQKHWATKLSKVKILGECVLILLLLVLRHNSPSFHSTQHPRATWNRLSLYLFIHLVCKTAVSRRGSASFSFQKWLSLFYHAHMKLYVWLL